MFQIRLWLESLASVRFGEGGVEFIDPFDDSSKSCLAEVLTLVRELAGHAWPKGRAVHLLRTFRCATNMYISSCTLIRVPLAFRSHRLFRPNIFIR